MEWKNKR